MSDLVCVFQHEKLDVLVKFLILLELCDVTQQKLTSLYLWSDLLLEINFRWHKRAIIKSRIRIIGLPTASTSGLEVIKQLIEKVLTRVIVLRSRIAALEIGLRRRCCRKRRVLILLCRTIVRALGGFEVRRFVHDERLGIRGLILGMILSLHHITAIVRRNGRSRIDLLGRRWRLV